jgi:hypothetical protein
MDYIILSPALHSTADAAVKYFRNVRGLPKFIAEQPINPEIQFISTLHTVDKDGHYYCVDVREKAYADPLDRFVLECKNKGLPVKLFVVVPTTAQAPLNFSDVRRAQDNGVGVLEVNERNICTPAHEALSLSLTGVRPINTQEFKREYRTPLCEAMSAFQSGDPVSGCSKIQAEIEALTRKIALKINSKGYWKIPPPAKTNYQIDPWFRITKLIIDNGNYSNFGCPDLKHALLGEVLGITQPRNENNHKIDSVKKRIKRDLDLRTRFEYATGLLLRLSKASAPLKP